MRTRQIRSLLGCLLPTACFALCAPAAPAQPASQHPRSRERVPSSPRPAPTRAAAAPAALILYHPASAKPINPELGAARMVGNLLGHFRVPVDIRPADTYREGQGDRYRSVFYVQIQPQLAPPAAALHDLPRLAVPVCWLGGGLVGPTGAAGRGRKEDRGFEVTGYEARSPFDRVRYHDALLARGETGMYVVKLTDPALAQVMATAVSPAGERPYALRSGHFWYFADTGVLGAAEADRALAFADLLHDMLGVRHAPSRQALIRIEDVSIDSNPGDLKRIADVLSRRHVPFMVAVIPIFKDPEKNLTVPMSQRPEFVEALRYMMARGGSIVMHGVTHQYRGASADDAEFFDLSDLPAQPIHENSPRYVEDRLQKGLRECLAVGVPPLAWETPHYMGTECAYRTLARVFDTVIEQRLVCDDQDYAQSFPYVVERDLFGQRIVPENLGYVPGDQPGHVEDLIGYARAHTVVRDSVIGAFFHPFLDPALLARLVDGFRSEGYGFVDLRRQSQAVHLQDMGIRSGSGQMTLQLKGEFLHEYCLDENNRRQRETWSHDRISGPVARSVNCPPGWIYVAEGRTSRPSASAESLHTYPRPAARRRSWFARTASAVRHLLPWGRPVPRGPAVASGAIAWDPAARGPELKNQQSYETAFGALGIRLERLSPAGVASRLANRGKGEGPVNLLVVPGAIANRLPRETVAAVLDYTRRGGGLITEGRSPLASGLGIRFGAQPVPVQSAQQLETPERLINWQRPAPVPELFPPDGMTVCTRDPATMNPLVVAGSVGKGALVELALPLDDQSDLGVARFPYLVRDALHHLGLCPPLRADRLHAFFDPDYRSGATLERLAAAWRNAGIGAIHVAAWKAGRRREPFDYDHLIRVCHRYGIAVYCWLELPMADGAFYEAHPEWREKSADGKTAYKRDESAWRYLMAMEDPACEAALLEWTRGMLSHHAWDGVDLAELYFESDLDNDPQSLTPMHATARQRFQALAGFDPVALVQPGSPHFWKTHPGDWKRFEDWRVAEVVRLHDDALAAIERTRNSTGQPLDVIVTVHDSYTVPTIRRDTGIDTPRIVELLLRHDFSLQIEDPAVLWNTDPRRYAAIAGRYARLLTPEQRERLMLDINVLDQPGTRQARRSLFPTVRQTGTEFYELLASAGRAVRRVTIYDEHTVHPDDWEFASAALAAADGTVRTTEMGGSARLARGAAIQGMPAEVSLAIDGREWPAESDGEIIVPPGKHEVTALGSGWPGWEAPLRVTESTVEILSADLARGTITIRYRGLGPGSIGLDAPPFQAALASEDGRPECLLPVITSGDAGVVMLPAGRHTVILQQDDPTRWRLSALSFYFSNAIVLAAGGSLGLLSLLYGSVRRRRRGEAAGE